jgi:hypothetical protein
MHTLVKAPLEKVIHDGSVELTGINGETLAEIMIMTRGVSSYYKWVPSRNFFDMPFSHELVCPGAPRIDRPSDILKWLARVAVWDAQYSKVPGLYSLHASGPYVADPFFVYMSMAISKCMSAVDIAMLFHLSASYVRDVYKEYFVVDTR